MSTYRRARSNTERAGVMRCVRPGSIREDPQPTHPHRLRKDGSPPGTRAELRITPPGECLIADCGRDAIDDDGICSVCAAQYRHYCVECGDYIRSDAAYDRNGGEFCLPCWGKTPAGKEWTKTRYAENKMIRLAKIEAEKRAERKAWVQRAIDRSQKNRLQPDN